RGHPAARGVHAVVRPDLRAVPHPGVRTLRPPTCSKPPPAPSGQSGRLTHNGLMTQTQHTSETAVAGRWWALAALAFAMLTVGLDMTILNVALPTLATELDASTTAMQWFGASFT